MGVFAELKRKHVSGLALPMPKIRVPPIGCLRFTINDIPKRVRDTFPLYLSDALPKSNYVRLYDVSRPIFYKYLTLMIDQ